MPKNNTTPKMKSKKIDTREWIIKRTNELLFNSHYPPRLEAINFEHYLSCKVQAIIDYLINQTREEKE